MAKNKSTRRPARRPGDPLLGKWFHAFEEDGSVGWQGQIVAAVKPGLYLAQLYEWMMGTAGRQVLVPVEKMAAWVFYDSSEDMRFEWDTHLQYVEQRRFEEEFRRREANGKTELRP
jgi:hypothetical protein